MKEFIKTISFPKVLKGIASPIIAVLIAFLLGGVVASIGSSNAAVAYKALYEGSLGSIGAIKQTIRYAIPILVLSMSFSICNQCGFFFIGQKGIMFMAGLCASWMEILLPGIPTPIMLPMILIVGMIIGSCVAIIPAFFKSRFGVNEAMIFVMLDYIVEFFVEYCLLYTAICSPGSAAMPKSLPVISSIPTIGLYIISLALVVVFGVLVKRSVIGYQIRMTGKNEVFARSCGVNTNKTLMRAAAIGGAFAGLAGLMEILGVYHTVYYNFASGNLAFMGITAALLGHESPIGMVFASLVLGAMQSGGIALSTKTNINSELVSVITGLIMFFATVDVIRNIVRRRKPVLNKIQRG